MSDTKTYRAISVKLAAFLCREKWSDELPEKTRKEMQRLVKEWQDVDRDHKPSDTTTERPVEAISPGLVKHYKQAAHQIGDLFTWCVEHMEGMRFAPDSPDWIEQIKERLLGLAAIKARLAEVEAERDKYKRIDECNQGTIDIAIRRAEAAGTRVKELEAFARLCRDGYDHDHVSLGLCRKCKATDVLATTPPATGAQS